MSKKVVISAPTVDRPSRPQPKSGYIPQNALGDILQIWNFFNTFSELFKFEDIAKEEIYFCLNYQGPESLALLNDMHEGILGLFYHEIKEKNLFDTLKDRVDHPFMVLLRNTLETGKKNNFELEGNEFQLIWTEFARNLVDCPPCNRMWSETTKRQFDTLGKKSCIEYNTIDYRVRVKMLLSLIEALYDTDHFRRIIDEKLEANDFLQKDKNDLQEDVKQDSEALKELKANLKNTDKENKGYAKLAADVAKAENALAKKKTRLAKMVFTLENPLQTAYYVGVDIHRTEYFVFEHDPSKLYLRFPAIVASEEEWYFYDTQTELFQLMDSLNSKGTKEKQLLEKLQHLVAIEKLRLRDDLATLEEKENVPPQKQRESTKRKGEKVSDMEEDKQNESSYWLAKVLEYDTLPVNPKMTRGQKQAVDSNKKRRKNPNTHLTLETIKKMLFDLEEKLNVYLVKWGSWWALQAEKEEVMNRLIQANSVPDLRDMLIEVNNRWRFGISYKDDATKSADSNSTEDKTEKDDEDSNHGSVQDNEGSIEEEGNNEAPIQMEMDKLDNRKTKKYWMRFWGMYTDKLRASWTNYTMKIDSIGSLYFATQMFCNAVGTYVDKGTVRYFTHFSSGKEFMESRKKAKVEPIQINISKERERRNTRKHYNVEEFESDSDISFEAEVAPRNKSRDVPAKNMKIQDLDNFKHKKKVVVSKPVRETRTNSGKSTAESETIQLRRSERSRTPSEERGGYSFRNKPVANSSKLDELANLRKSKRLQGKTAQAMIDERSSEEAEDEEEEEEEEAYMATRVSTRRSARRLS